MPSEELRTILSLRATLELAEAIKKRVGNRDLNISGDSDEAHRARCCYGVRGVNQAITASASIVVHESPTPNNDTATTEELEEYILSHIPSNRLKFLNGTIEPNAKAVLCSYARHKIPGMKIATRWSGGSDWDSSCSALVSWMEPLNFLDEEETGESCLIEVRQHTQSWKKANNDADDELQYTQATPERNIKPKVKWGA